MKKTIKRIISNILITAFLATTVFSQFSFAADQKASTARTDRAKVEIIVKYKNVGKSENVRSTVKNELDMSSFQVKKKMKNTRAELLEIGISDDMTKVINELKKNPDVEYVQPNYKLKSLDVIDDERFIEQWGLANKGQSVSLTNGVEGVDIDAETAWSITKGAASTVVGVLDTGIDISHNDLKDNIYVNPSDIPGNGVDDDGNGYIDDVNGWDFANGDNTVFDSAAEDRHGTHVAGIIAAGADNGGIKGAAPGVKVLPLKFINGTSGYTSDAIEAIDYAKALGVNIINCSFGGTDNNTALKDAMEGSGILFVCAAGNNAKDAEQYPVYPAAFDIGNVLSVAAMNNRGNLANFSNYGTNVDIAAPGVDILSTVPGNDYEMLGGTSMAAPFVSGIAALLKTQYPDMLGLDIKGRITANAVASADLSGRVSSNGWADANAALTGVTPEPVNGQVEDENANSSGQDSAVGALSVAVVSPSLQEQIHYGEHGINPGTGNYSKSFTDMSFSAPGFQVNITRTYNSKDERPTSTMGRGWTFGFEGSLSETTISSTTLKIAKLPNGSTQSFVVNTDGTYTANDSRSTLVKKAGNTHELTTKDQYTYGFNTSNYLVWMRDPKGNTISISVDSNGRVQKITDSVGRVYTVGYWEGTGYIKYVKDPIGRMAWYEYYPTTNYLKTACIKYPDTTVKSVKYEYHYDASGYLDQIKMVDETTNPVKSRITDQLVYNHASGDTQHRVTQYTDEYSNVYTYLYDVPAKKTTITDVAGRQIIKWYDTSYSITISQDPEGRQTKVEYFLDTNSHNMYCEEKIITDRNGNKTTYERDTKGNITKIIYPDNGYEEFGYDIKNNLIFEKDQNGKCTYYKYDAGMVYLMKKVQPLNGADTYTENAAQSSFAVTRYAYYTDADAAQMGCSGKGLLKSETDPEGNVTKYTYDRHGYKNSITDPENNTVTNTYNDIGWLESTTSAMGFKTDYSYDYDGRVVRTVLDGGETTRILYNVEGNKTWFIKPKVYDLNSDSSNGYSDGNVGTKYMYDDYTGKLVKMTEYLDSTISYETNYTYDIYGNLETETNRNNSRYFYEYDNMNRLKKVSFLEDVSSTSGQAKTLEEYSYSTLADGKSQKVHKRYLNDTEVALTTYKYDYANRLVEQINADGSVLYTNYNANGTVFSTTDGNGNTTYFNYDGLSRLSEKWEPLESGKYMYTAYKYDKAGKLIETRSGKDVVELYGVPASDRFVVKSYEYYKNGKQKTACDSAGSKTEFQYDADDNMIRKNEYTSADACDTTEYEYNHLAKPVSQTVYVKEVDIYGNDISSTTLKALTSTYEYDLDGNLISATDANGTKTTYTYDNFDRQTGTSQPGLDEEGNPVMLATSAEYDWNDKVIRTVDRNGNVTEYEYTARGFLEKVISKNVHDIDNTDPYDCITLYKYDLGGRKIAEVTPVNYISDDADMNRTEYVYDKMDRVKLKREVSIGTSFTTFVSKAYKYDSNGNVIKELDGMGYAAGTGATIDAKINNGYGAEYTYNAGNKLSMVLDAVGKDRGLAYSTKYDYDGAGRKISEEDGNEAVTCYNYDDAGNLTSTAVKKNPTASAQVIGSTTYDLAGNSIVRIDGNGNKTTYEYNAFGKPSKIVTPGDDSVPQNTIFLQYDKLGNTAWKQDSDGTTDIFTYDRQGHELTHTQQAANGSDSITVSKAYDKNGNVIAETDGNGNTTVYAYDELNRLNRTSITVKTVNNSEVPHVTKIIYDKNGNKTHEIDWRNADNWYEYDALGRLIKKHDPENPANIIQTLTYNASNSQIVSRDGRGHDTKFEYDKSNRLAATIDQMNHVTRQDYDNAGNISVKTDGNGNETNYKYDQFKRLICVTNAKNEKTTYTYDLCGNMLSQTDGNGNATTYEYNAINKPVRKIDPAGRKGSAGKYVYDSKKVEKYTYTTDGYMLTKIDRNGITTTYADDIHGRLLSQKVGEETISYVYDNNGNQLSMTDSTGTTTRTYDALNRVVTKSVPNFGTTIFTYDISVIADVIVEGYIGERSKDPKGVEALKVYDKAGRLSRVKGNGDSEPTVYTYDENGNRKSITYPGGASETYTYYDDNTLNTLLNKASTSTDMESFTYTYDNCHNQISKEHKKGSSLALFAATTYMYDSLNRLVKVTDDYVSHTDTITEFTYDKAGNRLKESTDKTGTLIVTSYIYNEQNRLVSTSKQENGVKELTRYSYDNNGNMTGQSLEKTKKVVDFSNPPKAHFGMFISGQQDGATQYAEEIAQATAFYEYNVWNQLVKTTTGTDTVLCKYNGDGLRVEKTVNGDITRYLYEYEKVVLETNGKGVVLARNVYGINLISRNAGTDKLYYMYNGHADVTMLIDNSGTPQASYYYDAFGTPITQLTDEGGKNNPIRYAGYQWDDEIGLYYLNSRYYDSKIARFLSEDTYTGDINDPLSLNLYTYCHNEPVMYVDPTGHMNIVNGHDYDADKYGKDSKVYDKLEDLTAQYNNAKTKKEKEDIAQKAKDLRAVADEQIKLNSLGIKGKDGKALVVDGIQGKNTNYAMDVYEQKNSSSNTNKPGNTSSSKPISPQPGNQTKNSNDISNKTSGSNTYELVPVENPGGGRMQDKTELKPENTVTVKAYSGTMVKLDYRAADALEALQKAAKADGIDILMPAGPKSAYRDDKTQKQMFDKKVAEVMKKNPELTKEQAEEVADDSVARPGGPHRTGRAIDFKLDEGISLTVSNASKLRKTEAYQWMKENAATYGFYNYKLEPWHWEYNPPAK